MSALDHDDRERWRSTPRTPALRCGATGLCAWMDAALLTNDGHAVNFARRVMEHPDTLKPVTRYVATVAGERAVKIAACPACGGNPNEETVYR